jgi:HlyD family secretion protein
VTFRVDAYPGRAFSGRVEAVHIAPELVQNVVTYTVMVAAENPDLALLPGMTAIARVRVAHAENPLRVPNAALRFRAPPGWEDDRSPPPPGTTRLWMAGDDGPRPVDVLLGPGDAAYTAVAEGALRVGDAVIVGLDAER